MKKFLRMFLCLVLVLGFVSLPGAELSVKAADQVITSVQATVKMPLGGKSAKDSDYTTGTVAASAPYTLKKVQWFNSSGNSFTGTFQNGATYKARVILVPKSGYKFENGKVSSCFINGHVGTENGIYSDGAYFLVNLTVPYFTTQPVSKELPDGKTIHIPFDTSFTREKLQLVSVQSGNVVKTYSNPSGTSCPFYNSEQGYFKLRAFYGTGTQDYIDSNAFMVTRCDLFETEPESADCETPGKQSYYICNNCGKCFDNDYELIKDIDNWGVRQPTGHEYDWKVVKRATSSKDGSKKGECGSCGKKVSKKTIYKISSQKLSFTKKVADGTQQIPDVIIKDRKGNVLQEGVHYTVTLPKDAVKVGRYKVYIKYKGEYSGSKTLYYTIVPKKVTGQSVTLSTASGGYDDIRFSWNASEGAKGYLVYYKKQTATKWSSSIATTKTYYTKKNLSDGVQYQFKVVPYYKTSSSKTKYYDSNEWAQASRYTLKKVSKPTISYEDFGVRVTWNEVKGATGYEISQSSSSKKTMLIKTAINEGTSVVVAAPIEVKRYYKVRAFYDVGDKRVYAPWSDTKSYKKVFD